MCVDLGEEELTLLSHQGAAGHRQGKDSGVGVHSSELRSTWGNGVRSTSATGMADAGREGACAGVPHPACQWGGTGEIQE